MKIIPHNLSALSNCAILQPSFVVSQAHKDGIFFVLKPWYRFSFNDVSFTYHRHGYLWQLRFNSSSEKEKEQRGTDACLIFYLRQTGLCAPYPSNLKPHE